MPLPVLPGQVLLKHGERQRAARVVSACRRAALVRLLKSVSSCKARLYDSALSFAACPLI